MEIPYSRATSNVRRMNERRKQLLNKQIGERLAEARYRAGLSQRAAGARLGESASFVSESETGRRRVLAVELGEFARVYRVPLAFFFEQPFDR